MKSTQLRSRALLSLLFVAVMLLAGAGAKEFTLPGTAWECHFVAPEGNVVQTFDYILSFSDETTGTIVVLLYEGQELVQDVDNPFDYTFDGEKGVMTQEEEGVEGLQRVDTPFHYDKEDGCLHFDNDGGLIFTQVK